VTDGGSGSSWLAGQQKKEGELGRSAELLSRTRSASLRRLGRATQKESLETVHRCGRRLPLGNTGYAHGVPRSLTISMPTEDAVNLVEELSSFDGILTLSRQAQASVVPPGDVVTVEVLDRRIPQLFALLNRYGAGTDDSVSVTTSEPTVVVSASSAAELASDPSSASFEEVEGLLERESTMGVNKVAAMIAAGAIAAAGLLTNSVHLVIGAMVIAPGFEPFLKVALRVSGPTRSFRRGFFDIGVGWVALLAGAAAGAVILRLAGISPDLALGGYLAQGTLVDYWRTLTWSDTLVAVVAAAAGTILVIANRALLTGGVMIALGLVPGATLLGIAAMEADPSLAADGALRWAHDALIVTIVGTAVLASYSYRRKRSLGEP